MSSSNGSFIETPRSHQLAFFSRGFNSSGGNAIPLQQMQFRGYAPSNYSAFSAAGTSQSSRRVRSWRHTSGGRSRVKWDTCVANGNPSSNLGRNLFPCGVFLSSTKSAGSMAHRDNRHSSGTSLHHRAARATRRCPVQPSTPLGPDQVDVLLLLSLSQNQSAFQVIL
jgi:hypothetical protein